MSVMDSQETQTRFLVFKCSERDISNATRMFDGSYWKDFGFRGKYLNRSQIWSFSQQLYS